MRRLLQLAPLSLVLLAGCGSQAKTVTVASAPTPGATATTQSTTTTSSAPAPPKTTSTPASSSTTTTRSAPEPSFTEPEQEAKSGTLGAAVAVLRARGYTPNNTAEYHPDQTLRVLIGTRHGSDASGMQAFFFLSGRYLGTDSKEPSGTLKVVSQSDTEVALGYPLYRKGDPLCCASGGTRIVHFALNNGKLTPLDAIPPASSSSGLARN
jgi:hypothetical protein